MKTPRAGGPLARSHSESSPAGSPALLRTLPFGEGVIEATANVDVYLLICPSASPAVETPKSTPTRIPKQKVDIHALRSIILLHDIEDLDTLLGERCQHVMK